MKKTNLPGASPRRQFLQRIASGAAALGLAGVISPIQQLKANVLHEPAAPGPEEWFNKIKGKHRMVFDVTGPHEVLPFAWPKVFLLTNAATGTPESETNSVVVLRHNAIPYAMEDSLWTKYNFGEVFKIEDPTTQKTATRNPFWKPKPGDFKVPGIGNVAIGINELQDSGVLFCVCNMALTVFSNVLADNMKMTAADVKADFMKGILPGIQVMPSGLWALGRAQEKGCAYCFAS